MNKIEKQKGGLVTLGIIGLVAAALFLVVGIILLVSGISTLANTGSLVGGILKTVFGGLMILLFFPLIGFGIHATWIGLSLKATKGSIKEGNIAKDGGTVNMRKCDKCGTELKDGETVCSNCGKEFK